MGQTHSQFKTDLCVLWVCTGFCHPQAYLGEFGGDLWRGCMGTVLIGGYSIVPCISCPVCRFCYIVCLKQDVNFLYASRVCYVCVG